MRERARALRARKGPPAPSERQCELCGDPFTTADHRRKYCGPCAPYMSGRSGGKTVTAYLAHKRSGTAAAMEVHQPFINRTIKCARCPSVFVVTQPKSAVPTSRKYCDPCAKFLRVEGFHGAMRPAAGYQHERAAARAAKAQP